MIKAAIIFVCAVIIALSITAVSLWGWGEKNSAKAADLARSLENEKAISSDLRVSLEAAQQTNSDLKSQLEYERQLLQDLQVDSQNLTTDFVQKQQEIRILKREDKEYSDWGNTALPVSVVGVLTKPTKTATDSNKN